MYRKGSPSPVSRSRSPISRENIPANVNPADLVPPTLAQKLERDVAKRLFDMFFSNIHHGEYNKKWNDLDDPKKFHKKKVTTATGEIIPQNCKTDRDRSRTPYYVDDAPRLAENKSLADMLQIVQDMRVYNELPPVRFAKFAEVVLQLREIIQKFNQVEDEHKYAIANLTKKNQDMHEYIENLHWKIEDLEKTHAKDMAFIVKVHDFFREENPQALGPPPITYDELLDELPNFKEYYRTRPPLDLAPRMDRNMDSRGYYDLHLEPLSVDQYSERTQPRAPRSENIYNSDQLSERMNPREQRNEHHTRNEQPVKKEQPKEEEKPKEAACCCNCLNHNATKVAGELPQNQNHTQNAPTAVAFAVQERGSPVPVRRNVQERPRDRSPILPDPQQADQDEEFMTEYARSYTAKAIPIEEVSPVRNNPMALFKHIENPQELGFYDRPAETTYVRVPARKKPEPTIEELPGFRKPQRSAAEELPRKKPEMRKYTPQRNQGLPNHIRNPSNNFSPEQEERIRGSVGRVKRLAFEKLNNPPPSNDVYGDNNQSPQEKNPFSMDLTQSEYKYVMENYPHLFQPQKTQASNLFRDDRDPGMEMIIDEGLDVLTRHRYDVGDPYYDEDQYYAPPPRIQQQNRNKYKGATYDDDEPIRPPIYQPTRAHEDERLNRSRVNNKFPAYPYEEEQPVRRPPMRDNARNMEDERPNKNRGPLRNDPVRTPVKDPVKYFEDERPIKPNKYIEDERPIKPNKYFEDEKPIKPNKYFEDNKPIKPSEPTRAEPIRNTPIKDPVRYMEDEKLGRTVESTRADPVRTPIRDPVKYLEDEQPIKPNKYFEDEKLSRPTESIREPERHGNATRLSNRAPRGSLNEVPEPIRNPLREPLNDVDIDLPENVRKPARSSMRNTELDKPIKRESLKEANKEVPEPVRNPVRESLRGMDIEKLPKRESLRESNRDGAKKNPVTSEEVKDQEHPEQKKEPNSVVNNFNKAKNDDPAHLKYALDVMKNHKEANEEIA